MVVRITRVRGSQAVDDQIVPQTTTRVADGDLYTGETQVADAGRPGVIRLVYTLVYADNKLVSRTLASRTQTQAMQPEVVQVGTKARPTYTVDSDGLDWSALADCESGGNPGSVSSDGLYFGLYQFSIRHLGRRRGQRAAERRQRLRADLPRPARISARRPWRVAGLRPVPLERPLRQVLRPDLPDLPG